MKGCTKERWDGMRHSSQACNHPRYIQTQDAVWHVLSTRGVLVGPCPRTHPTLVKLRNSSKYTIMKVQMKAAPMKGSEQLNEGRPIHFRPQSAQR